MTDETSASLVRCFDTTNPPDRAPAGFGAVLGYLGGSRASRVWPAREWLPFGHLRQFPCYVPDVFQSPTQQATDALYRAGELGWLPHRAIVGDLETQVDPEWWQAFADVIVGAQFVPVLYGSLFYALQNAASIVWAADWNDVPLVPPGVTIWASQDEPGLELPGGTIVDSSVLHSEMVKLGGRGPRRQP